MILMKAKFSQKQKKPSAVRKKENKMFNKLSCSPRKPDKAKILPLITLGLGLSFLSLAPVTHADEINTGFLYVSDYGLSELDRYQYTYDQTTNAITGIQAYGIGNNTSNAYFLGSSTNPIKEGVHGTANDLIIVGGPHGGTTSIQRYTLDGALIGTIPVDFGSFCASVSPQCNVNSLGIGNVLVTDNGTYMYAPLESAGYVVKVDLASGAIVASVQLTGAHDVAIAANGDVYAADYSSGPRKVIHLTDNLVFENNLITSVISTINGGTFRPSGLSVASDGSLYVQNNTSGGGCDSVLHYTFTGSGTGLTAALDQAGSYIGATGTTAGSCTSKNALEFTFGNNIGPDGDLYIAALGGGGHIFGTRAGYVDGIYKFDIAGGTNPTTAPVLNILLASNTGIAGYTETAGPNGPSGLRAPKYLQFDTNFATSPDAGYNAPEPNTLPMVAAGLIFTAAGRRLARRKSRNS